MKNNILYMMWRIFHNIFFRRKKDNIIYKIQYIYFIILIRLYDLIIKI